MQRVSTASIVSWNSLHELVNLSPLRSSRSRWLGKMASRNDLCKILHKLAMYGPVQQSVVYTRLHSSKLVYCRLTNKLVG